MIADRVLYKGGVHWTARFLTLLFGMIPARELDRFTDYAAAKGNTLVSTYNGFGAVRLSLFVYLGLAVASIFLSENEESSTTTLPHRSRGTNVR